MQGSFGVPEQGRQRRAGVGAGGEEKPEIALDRLPAARDSLPLKSCLSSLLHWRAAPVDGDLDLRRAHTCQQVSLQGNIGLF